MRIANTDAAIALKLGEQGVNENMAVQTLARAMQQGPAQVIEDAEYIFENFEMINMEFLDSVFGATTEMIVEAVVAFVAETSLLDELAAAGAALLALV